MQTQRPRLLVVDADRALLTLIGTIAIEEGFEVATTVDGIDALVQLRRRAFELVLFDSRTPGIAGLEGLSTIRDSNPHGALVPMSDRDAHDIAVSAVTLGAWDHLTKPLDVQRVRELLASVRDAASSRRALIALESELAQRLEFCGMIGRSPAMQDVFCLIRRLAPHARVALITGEPGTGKELAGRALHQRGPRSDRPFITVNCSGVVETLIESELFGHVRGAFVGARDDKPGALEAAGGGTVFLDDISDLSRGGQANLLRVLETGTVNRLGSREARPINVHVIAASRHNLRQAVAVGGFNTGLYERLSAASIELPPLRDRAEDLIYLTASFVRSFAQRFNKAVSGLTPAAERRVATAPWGGNVRQLQSVLERACILTESEFISDSDLELAMAPTARSERFSRSSGADGPSFGPVRLVDLEREHIVRTLDQARGNKAVAARFLGLSRRAFYRQLERHGLHTRVPAHRRTESPLAVAAGQHS